MGGVSGLLSWEGWWGEEGGGGVRREGWWGEEGGGWGGRRRRE